MTKNEYLKTLSGSLNGHLTRDEISEILRDYREFFEDGAMRNEDEVQVAERLGDPREAAAQIVAESYIDQALASPTVKNLFKTRTAVKALSAMTFVLSLPFIMGMAVAVILLAAAFLVLVTASLLIFSGLLMFAAALPLSAAVLLIAAALAALFASITVLLLMTMAVRSFVRWLAGLFAKAVARPSQSSSAKKKEQDSSDVREDTDHD